MEKTLKFQWIKILNRKMSIKKPVSLSSVYIKGSGYKLEKVSRTCLIWYLINIKSFAFHILSQRKDG